MWRAKSLAVVALSTVHLPTATMLGAALQTAPAPAEGAAALLPDYTSPGICDIFAKGGTPCVAAHSLTRALYATYDGALYSVQNNATGERMDIKPTTAGGVAHTQPLATFCAAVLCIVLKIYDQTDYHNDLGIERGFSYLKPPRDAVDAGVQLTSNGVKNMYFVFKMMYFAFKMMNLSAKVGLRGGKIVIYG